MWQIITAVGFMFLIMEMFFPGVFFLNFAVSAFFCAILSLFTEDITILTIVFSVLSVILIFTLRPMLIKKNNDKALETGIKSKYINKTAIAIEDINENSGAISIYDERWQARSQNENILKGSKVKILSNDGLIMNVEKID